jgi:predicted nuclease of predicted toxin-antitoxin system
VKLLLDQNLSPRLRNLLADLYPECTHVRAVGMASASDTLVWEYATAHGFTIVSKDADFRQRSLVLGSPPKVVWLRVGNCSVADSAALLRNRYVAIRRFVEESAADLLAIS